MLHSIISLVFLLTSHALFDPASISPQQASILNQAADRLEKRLKGTRKELKEIERKFYPPWWCFWCFRAGTVRTVPTFPRFIKYHPDMESVLRGSIKSTIEDLEKTEDDFLKNCTDERARRAGEALFYYPLSRYRILDSKPLDKRNFKSYLDEHDLLGKRTVLAFRAVATTGEDDIVVELTTYPEPGARVYYKKSSESDSEWKENPAPTKADLRLDRSDWDIRVEKEPEFQPEKRTLGLFDSPGSRVPFAITLRKKEQQKEQPKEEQKKKEKQKKTKKR